MPGLLPAVSPRARRLCGLTGAVALLLADSGARRDRDSARAIGLDHLVGTVAVGKRADLVLLRGLPRPSAGAAVVSATPSDVDTVLVDGRVVKRGGRLLDHDLAALRAAGRQLARRVLS